MALKVTKVDVWAGEVEDRAGALDEVLAALAEAGANLECVIARKAPENPGKGLVYLSPIKGRKAMEAAKAAGMKLSTDMGTLRIESPSKAGSGHKIMAAIAAAGIDVRGVTAVAQGNKAVAYVGFETPGDAAAAAKALRRVK